MNTLDEVDRAAIEQHIRMLRQGHGQEGLGTQEAMAADNLVAANQPDVYTYDNGIIRSVLNLSFASPEITKNVSSWEMLDIESLSNHRYREWSLQRMNRDEFLQTICTSNLKDSATVEAAAEALIKVRKRAYL